MRSSALRIAAFVLGALASAAPPSAFASDAGAPREHTSARGEDELARLAASPRALRSNVVRPGRAERYGHAEILIQAPLAAVRREVTNYPRYVEFDPTRFQKAKVIARRGTETDVYMQVPIMSGMVTLWDVTRFSAPSVVGPGTERVEGRFVKGNFKDLHVVWTLRSAGAGQTILECDLLLVLNMAVPQELSDTHHRESAAKAVENIKARLESGAPTLAVTP